MNPSGDVLQVTQGFLPNSGEHGGRYSRSVTPSTNSMEMKCVRVVFTSLEDLSDVGMA